MKLVCCTVLSYEEKALECFPFTSPESRYTWDNIQRRGKPCLGRPDRSAWKHDGRLVDFGETHWFLSFLLLAHAAAVAALSLSRPCGFDLSFLVVRSMQTFTFPQCGFQIQFVSVFRLPQHTMIGVSDNITIGKGFSRLLRCKSHSFHIPAILTNPNCGTRYAVVPEKALRSKARKCAAVNNYKIAIH